MRSWLSIAIFGFALFASAEAPAAAPVAPLLSHRAQYQMDLARAGQGSETVDITGRMVLEWAAACDGYTTTQRLVTRTTDNLGQEALNDFAASSWESRDGRKMRFTARQQVNGATVQEFLGNAELADGGVGGQAKYTKPEQKVMKLPRGTVFPTAEIHHILSIARAGGKRASDIVFDGSGDTALYEADAYIAPVPKGRAPEKAGGKLLSTVRSWKVQVSYFSFDSKEGVPEYELSFRLYENGVSTDLLLDYGNMAIQGELIGLQALPKSGC